MKKHLQSSRWAQEMATRRQCHREGGSIATVTVVILLIKVLATVAAFGARDGIARKCGQQLLEENGM